jgi:4-hydroxy-tetrahydrodipicolinate reductase
MALKVLLNGAQGRMGQAIQEAADSDSFEFVHKVDQDTPLPAALDEVDVIIDFSFREATLPLVEQAVLSRTPIVIGTTGHEPVVREAILQHAQKLPIVWSGNYSIGMNVLFHLTQVASGALSELYQPEIVEVHHKHKKDAPSGTAIDLAERICAGRNWDPTLVSCAGRSGMTGERPSQQIGIQAVRGGDVVGQHTVSFFGDGERVELSHLATDRKIFAQGALAAARWIVGKKPGHYEMQDVLNLR